MITEQDIQSFLTACYEQHLYRGQNNLLQALSLYPEGAGMVVLPYLLLQSSLGTPFSRIVADKKGNEYAAIPLQILAWVCEASYRVASLLNDQAKAAYGAIPLARAAYADHLALQANANIPPEVAQTQVEQTWNEFSQGIQMQSVATWGYELPIQTLEWLKRFYARYNMIACSDGNIAREAKIFIERLKSNDSVTNDKLDDFELWRLGVAPAGYSVVADHLNKTKKGIEYRVSTLRSSFFSSQEQPDTTTNTSVQPETGIQG